MTDLKCLRLVCGLRQIDVWAATGIPIGKLSRAERGHCDVLSDPEKEILKIFFNQQMELAKREHEAQQRIL